MIHDTLQSNGKELPLVTVIIPVYNTQDYIALCIKSVLNQTYQNLEIICIDDGSTDKSVEIIKRLSYNDPRLRLIQIENHGQGYARNLGLKEALGDYILFLDSDDFIEPVTLDLAVTRAENDGSDFVVFDWRYYNPISRRSNYCNEDTFYDENILEGKTCLRLLELSSYFTVNKLYRHSFLKDRKITYAEGYLYEDIIYWIKAVMYSTKVSLIHSPLYRVTISQTSSTKTAIDTDRHCKSFICAISDSIDFINENSNLLNENARYYLAKYFFEKFIYYYLQRTPRHLRKRFLKQFVDEFSKLEFQNKGDWKFFSISTKLNLFKRKAYSTFSFLFCLAAVCKPLIKRHIRYLKERMGKICKKLKKFTIQSRLFKRKEYKIDPWEKYKIYLKRSLYSDTVLFMGFDFRYTGNSRYLFEEMLQRNGKKKLFFVTDSPLVPIQYRIEPNSDRCARFVARSKVVIFESWIPSNYSKSAGAIWIQLWHGTPLKRMLFDSNEKAIITQNPHQKTSKFKNISQWDYLIVDNPNIKPFFQTAFLFPPEKMLGCGYPRVKYLMKKKEDKAYRDLLRSIYGILPHQKVVLYLPTWRDYNYKLDDGSCDTAYALDVEQLQTQLGENYFVISKDHAFISKLNSTRFSAFEGAETQELLLIADYLITDYSSVMFDSFALGLPVLLYCIDFEKNEKVRGVYPEMWEKISHLNCTTIEDIVTRIKDYMFDDRYHMIQESYCYLEDSSLDLTTFIESI